MKTFMQTKETVERTWYVIDAADKPLGRVATKAATILRGNIKQLLHLILIVEIM